MENNTLVVTSTYNGIEVTLKARADVAVYVNLSELLTQFHDCIRCSLHH